LHRGSHDHANIRENQRCVLKDAFRKFSSFSQEAKYLDQNGIFRFGPYVLNAPAGSLRKDDELIVLPPKVFDTLLVLVQKRGEVVIETANHECRVGVCN
jgi:DNA-binding response OmpR family regulator